MNLLTRMVLAALDVRLEHDSTGFTLEMGRGEHHRGVGVETAYVGRMRWHPRALELKANSLRLAAWGPTISKPRCPGSASGTAGHAHGSNPGDCAECARWCEERGGAP